MRIMLNPGSDRGIMVLKTYGYDLRELIINAIRNINGNGTHNPVAVDESFIDRVPTVNERISISVPDSELNGKVGELLAAARDNERGTILKEIVRFSIAKDLYVRSGGIIAKKPVGKETPQKKQEMDDDYFYDAFDDDVRKPPSHLSGNNSFGW